MKPARFILNTDYTTPRNTAIYEPEIIIPNDISYSSVPYGSVYTIGRVRLNKKNSDDSFLVYYSSSKYNYDSYGFNGDTKPEGATFTYTPSTGAYSTSDVITMRVIDKGSYIEFEVIATSSGGASFRYRGYGQTITAHILTFKDPFSA